MASFIFIIQSGEQLVCTYVFSQTGITRKNYTRSQNFNIKFNKKNDYYFAKKITDGEKCEQEQKNRGNIFMKNCSLRGFHLTMTTCNV